MKLTSGVGCAAVFKVHARTLRHRSPRSIMSCSRSRPTWRKTISLFARSTRKSPLSRARWTCAKSRCDSCAAASKGGSAANSTLPVLTLTGSGGFVSGDIDTLFKWDSRTWSIGPGLSLPIFAGGRNRSNYKRSQAAFEEAVARYRQQVLVAFGEVENSLSGIRHLADQYGAQARAVANARRAADLATERYRSGLVSYLEVVDASREALQAERGKATLSGQRLIASVQLIKALGGGWSEGELFAKAQPVRNPKISTKN